MFFSWQKGEAPDSENNRTALLRPRNQPFIRMEEMEPLSLPPQTSSSSSSHPLDQVPQEAKQRLKQLVSELTTFSQEEKAKTAAAETAGAARASNAAAGETAGGEASASAAVRPLGLPLRSNVIKIEPFKMGSYSTFGNNSSSGSSEEPIVLPPPKRCYSLFGSKK